MQETGGLGRSLFGEIRHCSEFRSSAIAHGALIAGVTVMLLAATCVESRADQPMSSVGKTSVVIKDVSGQIQDEVRKLQTSDQVHQDEVISTRLSSASEIVFLDGTQIGRAHV